MKTPQDIESEFSRNVWGMILCLAGFVALCVYFSSIGWLP